MKKFFVCAIPGGYAVAYHHAHLGVTAMSDHLTRDGAEAEADRQNLRHEAELARAAASKMANRQHAFSAGRPVRWFEPDAFA